MRIAIRHTTSYRFAEPARHGYARLHLRPARVATQEVIDWQLLIDGGTIEAEYEDHNLNPTTLVALVPGADEVTITALGTVETRDAAGIVGAHLGNMPSWLFLSPTPLTRPGPRLAALASRFDVASGNPIDSLHALAAAVGEAVAYEPGATDVETTAEQALELGKGVCQDHAHVFIAAARLLGIPARYVSGYLLTEGEAPEAGHGWAEALVPGLGWVGFDVSNEICPDAHYVRMAVGADYRDAAPITSLAQGVGATDLDVAVDLTQAPMAQSQAQCQ